MKDNSNHNGGKISRPHVLPSLPATPTRAAAPRAAEHHGPTQDTRQLPSGISGLHRTIGNRAVRALLEAAAGRRDAHPPPGRDPAGAIARAPTALPHRGDMERAFGRSFAGVEAYTGMAAELAPLGAQALTVGNTVAFADAAPSPALVAHEATHVVQNLRAGAAAAMAAGVVAPRHSAAEAEADAMAARVAAGGPGVQLPAVTAAPAASVHLAPVPAGKPGKPRKRARPGQRPDAAIDLDDEERVCRALEDGGACDARTLDTAPSSIDFGKVAVGEQVLRTITVTNTDAAKPVAIEDVAIVPGGLGDFVIYGVNPVLPPGGSANIVVGFTPTSAGAHAATAAITGDQGKLALGYVALSGEGRETAEHRKDRVARETARTQAARDDPRSPLRTERLSANLVVESWYSGLETTLQQTAFYMAQNWAQFVAATGGDFTVAWTEGQFINAVGAIGSGIVGLAPGGMAIDFTLSVLFSLIYGGLFTAKSNRDAEETVHQAVKKTGTAIEEQASRFEDQKTAALEHAEGLRSTALATIWSASTLDDIQQVRAWAEAERAAVRPGPKPSDRTLFKNLLKDWVLERAGDARSAGKGTNRPAYDEARATAFELGGDAKLARDDLFIYQARHEWSQLALGGIAPAEAELRAKLAEAEQLGRGAGLAGADLASLVLHTVGPERWSFLPVVDPAMTAGVLRATNVNVTADRLRGRRMGCQMFLAVDGASVVVRRFYYHLDGNLGDRTPK